MKTSMRGQATLKQGDRGIEPGSEFECVCSVTVKKAQQQHYEQGQAPAEKEKNVNQQYE
jgi:hypothetical protein